MPFLAEFIARHGVRFAVVFLVSASLFAAGFDLGWTEKGYRVGAERQAEAVEIENAARSAAEVANQKAKLLSDLKYQAEVKSAQDQKQIDKLHADNMRLASAVRLRYANPDRSGSMPKHSGTASVDHAAASFDEFPGKLAELSARLAQDADSNTEQLIRCQQYVRNQYEVMK